jgi:hypothetical protein
MSEPVVKSAPRRWWVRVLRALRVFAFVLLAVFAGLWAWLRHPLPDVVAGDADALARRMIASVDGDAWNRTMALRWTFADGSRHLWDRSRGFERYERGDLRVLLDLTTRRGRAWRGGRALSGDEQRDALELAWRRWINDSFWLNPVVKAFDDGVTRSVARDDNGREALLLSYASGGVTPGDRYLWILDANARPTAWRMWVKIIPVGGIEASWGGWRQLATGAWVSTRHRLGPREMELRDVAGAASLVALVGADDPFADLTR